MSQLDVDAMVANEIHHHRHPYVLTRFHDCSPVRLGYGAQQDKLMPVARYPVKEEDGDWSIVDWMAYQKRFPGYRPKKGTLELLAQGAYVTWTTGLGPGAELLGWKSFCLPNILERGNGSTIHSAVDGSVPAFSIARVCEMSAQVRLCET